MADHLILLQCGSSYSSQSSSSLPLLPSPLSARARVPLYVDIKDTPMTFPFMFQQDPIMRVLQSVRFSYPPEADFVINRVTYNGRKVTFKTYFRIPSQQVLHDEIYKWTTIGGLIAEGSYSTPKGWRYHMLLDNLVPKILKRTSEGAINKALSVQIRETNDILVHAFVTHIFANPQELFWRQTFPNHLRKQIVNHLWIATPIYFATQYPIDMAISIATQITGGPGFSIAWSTYQNKPVTVKKYFGTEGSDEIDLECDKWREIELLVGSAVGIILHDPNKRFYSMILGNFVPEMSQIVRDVAIQNALKGRMKEMRADLAQDYLTHALSNPQEFAWIHWGDEHWTAIPIHFIARDHVGSAIKFAQKPFVRRPDFFIARTTYNNKKVTLKTYTTIDLGRIYADCEQWEKTGLLDIAVDLAPNYGSKIKQFHMILDNAVPYMTEDDMHASITKALGKNADDHALANPHAFIWEERPSHSGIRVATPIKFPSLIHGDPVAHTMHYPSMAS